MTGVTPYATKERETAIRNAITQMQPPANVSTLHVPDRIRTILNRCWDQPSARPAIGWCSDALLQAILWQYMQHPFYNAQSKHGPQWLRRPVIHNPIAGNVYDIRTTSITMWVESTSLSFSVHKRGYPVCHKAIFRGGTSCLEILPESQAASNSIYGSNPPIST